MHQRDETVVEANEDSTGRGRWKMRTIVAAALAVVVFGAAVCYLAIMVVHDIRLYKARRDYPLTVCRTNMIGTAKAMIVYANDDPNGRLPPADKWCDLLVELDYTSPKQFVCRGSDAVVGESSFAINKNVVGLSLSNIRYVEGKIVTGIPSDIVLLFETDYGKDPNGRNELLKNRQFYNKMPYGQGGAKVFKNRWNQSGGAEILTTQHHEGKGCNVVFMDTHAEFVKTEDLDDLKWRADPNEN